MSKEKKHAIAQCWHTGEDGMSHSGSVEQWREREKTRTCRRRVTAVAVCEIRTVGVDLHNAGFDEGTVNLASLVVSHAEHRVYIYVKYPPPFLKSVDGKGVSSESNGNCLEQKWLMAPVTAVIDVSATFNARIGMTWGMPNLRIPKYRNTRMSRT